MLKGHIDTLTASHIHGWAYDPLHGGDVLEVVVLYGGQEIARTLANRYRKDLENINKNGRCAFTLNLAPVKDPGRLCVYAVNSHMASSPLPYQGKRLAHAREPKLNKKFSTNPGMWGLCPHIRSYSQLTASELYGKVGGNTGNLAFLNAIDRQLNICKYNGWSAPVKTAGTWIIPCANQLGSHIDLDSFAQQIEESDCKVVAIGLGAQSSSFDEIPEIPEGTFRWLKAVIEKAPHPGFPNITLRGKFTQKVLEHYGFPDAGIPMGCPSLFTSADRRLGKKIASNFRKPRRVAVAAGSYHTPELHDLEASLAAIAERTHGIYITQSPLGMNKIGRNEIEAMTPFERQAFRRHILQDLAETEAEEWIKLYARVFYNIDAWIEELRHADFVIGPRIHGIILGLQAGVPSLCLAIDTRTQELCEIMKVPYVSARKYSDGIELEDIESLFIFDPDEFDKNRIELVKQYVSFLENNYVAPMDWLKSLSV